MGLRKIKKVGNMMCSYGITAWYGYRNDYSVDHDEIACTKSKIEKVFGSVDSFEMYCETVIDVKITTGLSTYEGLTDTLLINVAGD